MSIKKKIKHAFFSRPKGILLFYRLRILREKRCVGKEDDYHFICRIFRERYGREIDLSTPSTYSEKLQWLKLFYHDPIMEVCSDKYAVRDYVKQQGHEELLNECYGVYENANDIDFESLPNRFAAKATHGSSWNLICKDKSKLDIKTWKKIMNQWLKLNLYVFGREWNYKNIKPRIIVEKYLDKEPLIDYKFMCFDGEPKFMQINNDFEGKHYVDFFDMDWNYAGFTYRGYTTSNNHKVEKPEGFEVMKALAKEFAKPFPFVHVDFYRVDGKTIFGELTFFPGGGVSPMVPNGDKFDREFAKWITLPEPNYNLDLLKKIQEG